MKKLLSEKEAAEMLGISVDTIRRMRRAGQINAVKIGRMVRYRQEDIEAVAQ